MRTLATLTLAALIATPALAEPERITCLSYEDTVAKLADMYDERPSHSGLMADGHLVILFVGPYSFTFVKMDPMGKTCPLSWGEGWDERTPSLPPVGDPA